MIYNSTNMYSANVLINFIQKLMKKILEIFYWNFSFILLLFTRHMQNFLLSSFIWIKGYSTLSYNIKYLNSIRILLTALSFYLGNDSWSLLSIFLITFFELIIYFLVLFNYRTKPYISFSICIKTFKLRKIFLRIFSRTNLR